MTKENIMNRKPLQSYRELKIWKMAMDLVEKIYRITKTFPDDERFGLTSQMRRAAASIPANIAEGYGRFHRGEYLHHLSIARGSLCELETFILISKKLQFINEESPAKVWDITQQLGKMIIKIIEMLQQKED